MDIEKLKSIIRLANNNPNENEANLAARKACMILAENNFALFNTQPTTWNDVKRSTEPAWRTYTTSAGTGQDPFWDFIRRYGQPGSGFRPTEKQRQYYEDRARYAEHVRYNPVTDEKEKQRAKAERKCSICGLEVNTFRVKEEPFICNPCHWATTK
jgi:CRISPR/Cas system-associated protein Cas10 (large subunit of type III CRISPR-Cas system)